MSTRVHESTNATLAAGVVLAFATLLCVAGIFALTAHGNYGFGRELLRLGPILSWAVVITLDVLQVVGIASAFLVSQTAPKGVRSYAWGVFGIANIGSVASNVSYATARNLPVEGVVGSAVLPLMLTFGVHLGVLTWRWRPGVARSAMPAGVPMGSPEPIHAGDNAVPKAKPQVSVPATPVVGTHDFQQPVKLTKPVAKAAPDRKLVHNARPEATAEVRRRWREGERDKNALATEYNVTPRTIENWTRELRTTDNGRKS